MIKTLTYVPKVEALATNFNFMFIKKAFLVIGHCVSTHGVFGLDSGLFFSALLKSSILTVVQSCFKLKFYSEAGIYPSVKTL